MAPVHAGRRGMSSPRIEVTRPYPYLPDLQAQTVPAYLDELEAEGVRGLDRGRAVALMRKVSSPKLREWVKLRGAVVVAPAVRRRIRNMLAEGREIRINLGSGPLKIPGWIGIDGIGMGADLTWDLTRGVPFPDGSVNAVLLEHVLEHFSFADGLSILAECRRVLEPGGIIRVGVPDFGRYIESYAGDRRFVEDLRPGRPTALLAVAEVALHHGHRSVWDGETLERVLTDAGFVGARRRSFGDSDLVPAPDSSLREPETVYAEARQPG
jgi:predicted SAM-dependent methyltransferase